MTQFTHAGFPFVFSLGQTLLSSFLLTSCPCLFWGMGQGEKRREAVVCHHCCSYQSSFCYAVRTISGLLVAFCPSSSGGDC